LPYYTGGFWEGIQPYLYYYTNNQSPALYGDSANCFLSLDEPEESSVCIFPNPVTDYLGIYTGEAGVPEQIIIRDLYGRIIRNAVPQSSQLNIQDISSGVYLLSVHLSTGRDYNLRFIKR